MEKAKVSVIQLFAMMFIFNLGTALIVAYGINAQKDAWLAILLGMCMGMVLFFIYYSLFRQYPTLPLTGYARKIFGKHLGWIIGLLYVLIFLYMSARNARDFGDLLVSSTLTETPLLAVNFSLVLVICYVLYLGIEVLGRTAEVFIVVLLFLGIAGNFFIFISGNVDFHKLQPFLENGWKLPLKVAFRDVFFFPFGEMIAFTMLLPHLNSPKLVKRVWLSAIVSSGLILSWTASLNIAVLSVDVTKRSVFPTLVTIGKVNLLDFIERLDAVVVFTMLLTVFFKVSIFLYGALIGIVDLFKLNNRQQILLPIGGIVIFLSMTMASSFPEHLEEGHDVLHYYFIGFHLLIPLLMCLVSMIRNGLRKKDRSKPNVI
jgi:spore germination protein KB